MSSVINSVCSLDKTPRFSITNARCRQPELEIVEIQLSKPQDSLLDKEAQDFRVSNRAIIILGCKLQIFNYIIHSWHYFGQETQVLLLSDTIVIILDQKHKFSVIRYGNTLTWTRSKSLLLSDIVVINMDKKHSLPSTMVLNRDYKLQNFKQKPSASYLGKKLCSFIKNGNDLLGQEYLCFQVVQYTSLLI